MLLRYLIILIALCGWLISAAQTDSFVTAFDSAKTPTTRTIPADAPANAAWRYTADGWKLIPVIKSEKIIVEEAQPFFHPLFWLVVKLFLLAGVVTWASNEWEWKQLTSVFRKRTKPKSQPLELENPDKV